MRRAFRPTRLTRLAAYDQTMQAVRRSAAMTRAVDALLLVVLVALTAWLGQRVIGAVYRDNPKIAFLQPRPGPLVICAWVATVLQLGLVAGVWRRAPLLTWVVAAAGLVVHVVTIQRLAAQAPHPFGFAPLVPSDVVVLLGLYAYAARHRQTSSLGLAGVTAGLCLLAANRPLFGPHVLGSALLLSLTAAAWIGGLSARTHAAYVDGLQERATAMEQARVRESALAVAAERARLSREIHDTVAHALAIIVVQAQGAAAAQRTRPGQAGDALDAIVAVGRDALAEMRQLLTTDVPAADRTPTTGVGDLAELVERFRAAGRVVDVVVEQVPTALPSLLDHSIYRIVQESLTNAVKHSAADSAISVQIAQCAGWVEVRVHDSGGGEFKAARDGTGHGLLGMRERVALLGGELHAGTGPDGGFLIHARLPLATPSRDALDAIT